MPTPVSNKRFRTLLKSKDISLVSKVLQGRDVDLLDPCLRFDELIAVKPRYERYLRPRADIIRKKAALLPFAKPTETETNQGNEDDSLSFVERLRTRRRLEHLRAAKVGSTNI
ncbi:hypothetical protein GQ600_11332 [Phytophthora cactorum]|nr:hypothetical protein GQ600_11332 [Phytophthora cactorum]